MRIWSIHPKYLDTKGLVALWRETLLAQHVLAGKTRGYKNHPQLQRFKMQARPLEAINQYLSVVYTDAKQRGFNFNKNKIDESFTRQSISVTHMQLEYEQKHLLLKLKSRCEQEYIRLKNEALFIPHPLFFMIEGDIETWEVVH